MGICQEMWLEKSFIFADFLQGEGGCYNCDDEAVKRVAIYTCSAITGMEFHTVILSFCQ